MGAEELNSLTKAIIAAAIEVHQILGPGLLESVYRKATAIELRSRGYHVREEDELPVRYKGHDLGLGFRIDMIVEDSVIIEFKCVEAILPVHAAQLRSYLVAADLRVGLILNFRERILTDGIKRVVNKFPEPAQH